MKPEHILHADLLDIIFEKRNKSYGAYPLRKYYNERLYKALGILFLFISILSVYALLQKKTVVYSIPDIDVHPGSIPQTLPPKKIPAPVAQAKPKEKTLEKRTDMQQWNKLIIVDSKDSVDKLHNLVDSMAIGTKTIKGPTGVKPVIIPVPIPGVTGGGPVKNKAIDKITPVMTAEVMPAFPGGMDALRKFLERNLRNPRDLEQGEMISVKIRFIVGFDGMLKGFETVEDGGPDFNNEVIRVLKRMPEWIPGKTSGENVSVHYTIPVKFISPEQ